MSQSRLEIKITKDVDDRDVNLKAMSLLAAKSFLALFESITKIVELTPENKDIQIQITSGSAVVAAEGETIGKAKQEFDRVLQHKSKNKELVEQWRRIQSVFSANGLQYEANFYENDEKTSFYEVLKKSPKLRTKPTPKSYKTNLEFLTGKLISVGGKKPNIHVEVDGVTLPPIACTEINASKAKAYLYQTIRFSAYAQKSKDKTHYVLCDSYVREEMFSELKKVVLDLFAREEIEMLKTLHYQCRFYLDQKDYGTLRKFLRLFTHESTDINILKMILVVTQSFKEQERLKESIGGLQQLYEKRFYHLSKFTADK